MNASIQTAALTASQLEALGYRVIQVHIGGHGPALDAIPFFPNGRPDETRPIYRDWLQGTERIFRQMKGAHA